MQDALDQVGQRIITGAPGYRPKDVLSADTVADKLALSKPMARDVLQALHHMKLMRIQPRHGAVIQPWPEWDMLHPTVIRWRLADPSSRRHAQRSLAELRGVLEPEAARLAARRASAEVCYELINLADELDDIGRSGDFTDEAVRQRFREVDATFHTTLLTASGNEAFRSLAHPVVEAMNHRIDREWAGRAEAAESGAPRPAGRVQMFPPRPAAIAMSFHRCMARAVSQGLPDAAVAFTRALLAEIDGELLTDATLRTSVRHGLADLDLPAEEQRSIESELDEALRTARSRRTERHGSPQSS
jgi:DNA-binding FadR family transcriptional regulator